MKAYYDSLRARKKANYALTAKETQAYKDIATVLRNYYADIKLQEAVKKHGEAEAKLQSLLGLIAEAELKQELRKLENLRAQEKAYRKAAKLAEDQLQELRDEQAAGTSAVVIPPAAPQGAAATAAAATEGTEEEEEGEEEEGEEEEGDDDGADEDEDDEEPVQGPPAPGAPAPGAPGGAPVPNPNPGGAAGVMAAQAPKGTELLAIPLYSGDGMEAEVWIDLVERAARTYNWHNDSKAGAACLRLSDKALVWLDAQKKIGVTLETKTWDEFKEAFLERFRPKDDTIRATDAIFELRQKSNESVAAFYDRCCLAVVAKNKPGFTDENRRQDWYPTVRDSDIYSFMCSGLDSKIRRIVMGSASPPKNIKDLRKMAVETEAALAAQHTKEVNEMSKNLGENKIEDKEDKADDLQDKDKTTEKMERLEQELAVLKKGLQCYFCKEYGHTQRECPKRLQQQKQQPQRGGFRGRGGGGFRGAGNRGRGFGGNNYSNFNNWRGRGRGRGFGGQGYGRGRGFVPQAYFGQPGYFNQGFGQRGGYQGGQGYGLNQMNNMTQNSFIGGTSAGMTPGLQPGQQQQGPGGLWEIVEDYPN